MHSDIRDIGSPARIQALRELALLDTSPDPRFDRFTRLAAGALGMPVSLVSLVDEDRQFFKSCLGLPEPLATARESPLSHSVCQHVAVSREPLLVADARDEPLLRDNGAVTEWGLVSYAGVPLLTTDGHAIGSLCVIGFEPRRWTEADLSCLIDLAEILMEEIEGRARTLVSERGHDALGHSLARFRSTVEGLAEGVALVRLDGTVDYVSPRLLEMTGYGWSALVGRPVHRTLLACESPDEVRARLGRRARGETERYESRLRTADGSEIAVEVGGAPLRDAAGKIVGAVKTFIDITWRQHQAEVLRESEERFRAVFQNAPLGIALLGSGGKILDANPALRRLLGDEVLGRGMDEMAEGQDRLALRGLYPRSSVAGTEVREQVTLHSRGGRAMAVRVVASRLETAAPSEAPLVLAMLEDVTASRAGEAALRERSLILESISDAVLAVELDGRISAWNAGAERLYGYAAGEILGRRADTLLAPADRARMHELLMSEVGRDGRWAGEFTIQRKDGTHRTADASIVMRYDGDGRPLSHIAVVRDVTERKQADEALRRSQQMLQEAQGIAGLGTWVRNVAEGTLEWSAQTYRLFGYEPGEVQTPFELYMLHVHPQDRAHVAHRIEEAMRAGGRFEYQHRVIRADGELRHQHIRGAVTLNAAGEPVRGVGVVQDVTEWKAAEEELRRQALLFLNIHDAVCVLDARGRIVDCNPAAERLHGMARGDTIGREAAGMVGIGARARREITRTVRRAGTWAGSVEYALPGGGQGVLEGTALRNDGGMILVYRDVTDRVALEDRLRHAQKMEAVGRLAGGIAHDFNNILMAVGGFARLLQARITDAHPERGWLDEITRGTERAAALTAQLLAFSRKQVLRPEPLDLNHAVRDTLPLLERLVGERVAIETAFAPRLPPIRVDRGQLDQVLMNLGINARDAMPGGGSLVLSTDVAAVGPESGLALPDGLYARLTVADSGEGIAPEVLGHIFEPFFTTKPQGKGTGLGLSTVEGILAQSGGAIQVESAPGQGAAFRIYLPFAEEQPVEAAGPGGPPVQSRAATVLLVEDDPSVLALARVVLEGEGYHVLTATRGAEALDTAAAHPGEIDLLLSDVMMPGMTGPEVARHLVQRIPGLRVGLMSGHTGDTIPEALVDGFDLAHKPIDPDDLVRWVAALLSAG